MRNVHNDNQVFNSELLLELHAFWSDSTWYYGAIISFDITLDQICGEGRLPTQLHGMESESKDAQDNLLHLHQLQQLLFHSHLPLHHKCLVALTAT